MTQHSDDPRFHSGSYSTQKAEELKQMLKGEHDKSLKTNQNAKEFSNLATPMEPVTEDASSELLKAKLSAAEQEIDSLKAQLEDVQKEAHTEHLRHLADLENARRRLDRDRDDWLRYGNESLFRDLLNTVDNLERTLDYIAPGEAQNSLRNGIELVLKQLLNTLQQAGVREVATQGGAFNPHLHEAIGARGEDGKEPDSILEVHQKGYQYHDRLLRPARVTIAS